MQSNQPCSPDEAIMMKLLSKIQMHEAQRTLLVETINNRILLESKILSSLQPSIGRMFIHENLEARKMSVLTNTRKKLMQIAIEEKDLELQSLNADFTEKKQSYVERSGNATQFLNKMENVSTKNSHNINERMNKKINFHLQQQHQTIVFTTVKTQVKKKRTWTANRKRKNRLKYNMKQKEKKHQKVVSMVNKIKEENIVVNLSQEELPDCAYLFLAKGLGFIPTRRVDIQDLKYDTNEFIRKLAWKAYFKANPELQTSTFDPKHQDIRVSSYSYPSFTHPLLDDVKTKLLGWIANHAPSTPKSNLTLLEIQGKKWLTDEIKNKRLFVSKCDKGGAILVSKGDKGRAIIVINYHDIE